MAKKKPPRARPKAPSGGKRSGSDPRNEATAVEFEQEGMGVAPKE